MQIDDRSRHGVALGGIGRHGEAWGGLWRHAEAEAYAGMGRSMEACRGLCRHAEAYAATQRDMQTNDLNDQLKTAMQLQAVLMYLCLSSAIPKKLLVQLRRIFVCVCVCVCVCFKVNAHDYAASLLRLMNVAVSVSALVCA